MQTDAESQTAPVSTHVPLNESTNSSRRLKKFGWYLLLSVLAVFALFPIYLTVVRALSDPSLSLLEPGFKPEGTQWDVFSRAWEQSDIGRHILISLVVTVVIVVGQTITSILAAYAFTFLEFPFKRTLFALTMATLLLPIEVTLISNVKSMQNLGWIGTQQSLPNAISALVLPFLATALGVFLIRQGFMGIPKDLKDAAALDGWGHLGFIRHVAVPVSRPIIASFVVISFLTAYNQYLWPVSVGTKQANYTAQVAVKSIATEQIDQINIAFAAALMISLPVLALLLFFQRHLVAGLTAGAVKG